jgi:hypothetical protein
LCFIQNELAFETLSDARKFVETHGSAFFINPNAIDRELTVECKSAAPQLAQVYEEKYRKVGIKGAI